MSGDVPTLHLDTGILHSTRVRYKCMLAVLTVLSGAPLTTRIVFSTKLASRVSLNVISPISQVQASPHMYGEQCAVVVLTGLSSLSYHCIVLTTECASQV